MVTKTQQTCTAHMMKIERLWTVESVSWAQKNNHRIGLTGVAQVLFWVHRGKNLLKTENEFGKDWSQGN